MVKYKIETTPEFEKEFRKLKKRFLHIDDDFEEFLDEIELKGDLGVPVTGVKMENGHKGNKIFKKRMKNTSANQGKSGGLRVIEYLITSSNTVYLLDIYSKNVQEDIPKKKIIGLMNKNTDLLLNKE